MRTPTTPVPGSGTRRFDVTYWRSLFVCAALSGACAPDDGPLDIAGSYLDNFGTTHEITTSDWQQTYGTSVTAFAIVSYDNGEQHVIAQNDDANGYNPGLWSRFDWVEGEDVVYVCQTAFDAPSEQDAQDTPRADDSDPATGGCGAFAWSALFPL